MALIFFFPPSPTHIVPTTRHHCNNINNIPLKTHSLNLSGYTKPPFKYTNIYTNSRSDQSSKTLKFICRDGGMEQDPDFETTIDFEFVDSSGVEDLGSPWEGAIIYRRSPSISHLEYCTTLERLGLGGFSTEVSKSRASVMGLRITKAVKDYPSGTPVQVSIDVTRKKQKLRLDGIVKTVLSLRCYRCGKPAAKCIFSNFTLLLDEQPIEEPEIIDMGAILRKHKSKTSGEEEFDVDDLIDLDDQLYFPAKNKEIDISKNIRDMVHLEITIDTICDSSCKGICLKCGTNLNTSSCTCSKEEVITKKTHSPFGDLRSRMQRK